MALATLDRTESASRGEKAECTWQTDAIQAYRFAVMQEESTLRAEMADRVAALTGCRIPPQQVAVDCDARIAFLALDGVRFRLRQHEVVLLRPCANCGTGEFASDPLTTKGDLGHALGVWRPLHHGCEVENPAEW